MRLARRPTGLLWPLIAILLLALGIEFVASTIVYERSSRSLIREDEARRLAEHLVIARKLLSEQPWSGRPALAARLTTNRYDVHWTSSTSMPPARHKPTEALERVLAWEPSLADSDVRIDVVTVGRRARIVGELKLPDGTWMRFRAVEPEAEYQPGWHRVLMALVPAMLLLLIGAYLLHRALRPMGTLTRAVDQIGLTGGLAVEEAGTREVRRLIRAFNAMQSRIQRLISDRTQALAAVGHDLRTPLARLQLRADSIEDPQVRTAIESDVAEMEAMVVSLLAYLGGEDDPEPRVRTDVAVMASTIVDDVSDRGLEAHYIGDDHVEALVRPIGLKRAIANLVENALHYGGSATVSVTTNDGKLLIRVEDEGPGIPDELLEAVTAPFMRLDPARSRNTSGLGLGLAIVQREVEAEAGTLTLSNRPEGGLRAEICLPLR